MPEAFDSQEPVLTIGLAAERTGVSVPTIRLYEMEGLLIPFRTPSGRRLYSYEDLRRIQCIRHLIHDEGLNLAGVRRLVALLPCWRLKPHNDETDGPMAECTAIQQEKEPCWIIRRREGKRTDEECRRCEVYRNALSCTHEMKTLYRELATCKPQDLRPSQQGGSAE